MSSKDITLKPCPFCAAECDHEIDGDPDDGYAVYITAEHQSWCPISASDQTAPDNGLIFTYETDEELNKIFEFWNRREAPNGQG